MPRLYILTGLPFSGKSTMLKVISELTEIKTIAFDKFWVQLEEKLSEEDKKKLSFEYVTSLIDKEIEKLLKDGNDVAYDTLNDTVDQRDRLRQIALNSNATAVVIYLNTPLEEIKNRRLINEISQERHQVDDENFNKSINKFVPPQEHEDFIEYLPEQQIEKWIKRYL